MQGEKTITVTEQLITMITKCFISFLIIFSLAQCIRKGDENTRNSIITNPQTSGQSAPEEIEISLNSKEYSINEALIKSIETSDNIERIIELINEGADVNYVNEIGAYPLLVAIQRTDNKIKDELINILNDFGAKDINSLIEKFFDHCEKGQLDSLKSMISDGFNVNWEQKHFEEYPEGDLGDGCGCICKKNAIFIAAKNQDSTLVKFLIDNGAKVFLEKGALQPLEPVILAENWQLAHLLIQHGASKEVSACSFWGWEGLSYGNTYYHKLKKNDTKTLDFLIENNFPYPDFIDDWNHTPIDIAVRRNDYELLNKLIPLNNNNAALSKALCFTKNIEIAKLLLKNGANPNYIYTGAVDLIFTPLFTAIEANNTRLVNLYIDSGADVNVFYDKFNETVSRHGFIALPLLQAVIEDNIEIAKILLENNAKVNFHVKLSPSSPNLEFRNTPVQNEFWYSPLGEAISRNNKPMAELLIQFGANVIIKGDTITNYKYGRAIDIEILKLFDKE